ncbi:hypothetical protein ACHZ97_09400 [Lysobacter soli]|uniref:hypothetical protein n=1 Tax=Lysobacter soli TaxID=453783 RepID=UPI0037C70F8C
MAKVPERVWIPELPAHSDPLRRAALAPQDLRTHYAEMTQYAMPRWQWVDRSPLSRVLGRYFRFMPVDMSSKAQTRHVEGVRRVVERARVLAMMAGHRCVEGPLDRIWQDDYPCPCAVGYQLWLRRVGSDHFETTGRDVGLDPERYEGSHLGLCLSAAWFASVQSRMLGEPSAYRTLLAFLEAPAVPPSMAQVAGETPAAILALLSHTFQWFAVGCPGPAQAVIRARARLEAIGRASQPRAPDAAVRDAVWIMHNL